MSPATVNTQGAAPAAGVTLNVQCDNRTIAQPPLTVTVPSGQTSVGFTITTAPVAVTRFVTITVAYAGATQSVSPGVWISRKIPRVGFTDHFSEPGHRRRDCDRDHHARGDRALGWDLH